MKRRIIIGFSCVAVILAWLTLVIMGAYLFLGFAWSSLGSIAPIPFLGNIFRIKATFSSWELFGNFLTFTLPLVAACASGSHRRESQKWWWFSLGAVILAGICTVSHSIVGLFASLLFFVWSFWKKGTLRFLRVGFLLLFLFLFVGVNVVSIIAIRNVQVTHDMDPLTKAPVYNYAFHNDKVGARRMTLAVSYDLMNYYLLKKIALNAFIHHPFTGIGLGRFHGETERAYLEGRIQEVSRHLDPHCTLCGRLAETGLWGGIALVMLWVGFLWFGLGLMKKQNGNDLRYGMKRAFIAGLIGLLVNSVNVDIMNFRFLWIGLAMIRSEAFGMG